MSKRKTLGKLNMFERMCRRGAIAKTVTQHIRAELDRLARQVRKLNTSTGQFYGCDESRICIRRADVLKLIREAKR